jgi:ribosomal protein S12 methylthiotransferase accessory factor
MDVSVGIVGSGRGAAAVEAALGDAGVDPARIDASEVESVAYPVVIGAAGDPAFERAHDAGVTWLAIELGGIGGQPRPGVDATVSILGDAACFHCLQRRVRAHAGDQDGSSSPGRETASGVTARTERLAGAVAGHRLLEWIDGENGVGDVLELPYTHRRLFPVPGCDCLSPTDRAIEREYVPVDIEATVERAESVVDPRLGVVSQVGEANSFPAPYYLAILADTEGFSDVAAGPHAAGVSADWNAAYVKAVGEALERYAAGVYRAGDFEEAPATEMEAPVSPGAFVLPDEGYAEPDPGEPIRWASGENLRTGEPVDLPAEFVQFPPPERRHKPSITTGLGLGTSGVGALLSGLYETVERDATMLAWYSTFEPVGLTVDSPEFETLRRRARAEGLSVTPLLVTADVDVPVVSVAVYREAEWPKFAVGSAATLDPDAAAEGALCEAIQNWMELREMGPEGASEESTAIGRYADFPREAREFVSVDAELPAADVGPETIPEGEAELDAVMDRVAAAGMSTYAARLTTRDVEQAGFEVVRVLVPEAQPLFTGDRYFGERARTVPREMGYTPRLDHPPHPYP